MGRSIFPFRFLGDDHSVDIRMKTIIDVFEVKRWD